MLSKTGIYGHSPKSVVIASGQVAQVTCATRVVGFRRQSCRHSCHRPDIELALSLGTTDVVDYHQEDLFDTLANNSVDVVLDNLGFPGTADRRCETNPMPPQPDDSGWVCVSTKLGNSMYGWLFGMSCSFTYQVLAVLYLLGIW